MKQLPNRKLTVKVTEEDIALGHRFEPDACPIALAVGRAINHRARVFVGLASMTLRYYTPTGHVDTLIRLPTLAYLFLENFDINRPAEPFEFELDLSEDSYQELLEAA